MSQYVCVPGWRGGGGMWGLQVGREVYVLKQLSVQGILTLSYVGKLTN